jgi:hypothetical protein
MGVLVLLTSVKAIVAYVVAGGVAFWWTGRDVRAAERKAMRVPHQFDRY